MTHQFDKAMPPGRHAPLRGYHHAMSMTGEGIARPFVAVASAGSGSAPCNTGVDPAYAGAVMHAGARGEAHVHADI